ncbi:MarR family transcriptional regulator [Nonomuraea phyllanthi]|uniref:MarR family winged helix-turn-helix transcriptional regulator n=1 Tax=Nonomuraea phyllanthi TaxID=2219224 RepID=UPI00129409FB|nr:MarR family transcriptional regulator [Nonomuraea phyllanthi]QFY09978.1 MarR family transcriptional regulator [Nonomuraea phyllanthi]
MTVADGGRRDLAASLHALVRSLIAAELPVLDRHGISMWGYAVLGALCDSPVRTQAALAETIAADKTRIIGTLDILQEAGLISRIPDPGDRRARLLSITEAGRALYDSAQAEIHSNEDRLLAMLPEEDRRGFLRAVRTLSALPHDQVVGHQDPRAPADVAPA